MRIEFTNIEDFCSELRCGSDGSHSLFDDTVRVRVDREPLQREEISHRVTFRATTIVILDGDGSEYLADMGLFAGIDDAEGQYGSCQAANWRDQIEAVCKERGLKMRPGRIEV